MAQSPYQIGQFVYLLTDSEQQRRIITAYTVRPTGRQYELSKGTCASWHYDFEITAERNVLLATTN